MRINPIHMTPRLHDRRQRTRNDGYQGPCRRLRTERRRARNVAQTWLDAPFAAQLIGQKAFLEADDPRAGYATYQNASNVRLRPTQSRRA